MPAGGVVVYEREDKTNKSRLIVDGEIVWSGKDTAEAADEWRPLLDAARTEQPEEPEPETERSPNGTEAEPAEEPWQQRRR